MNPHWIVTVDGRRASLFACKGTPGGTLHISPVRSLENPHENEHEHHRPGMLGGGERRGALGRGGGSAAPHSISPGHGAEEETSRFAKEVGDWLSLATEKFETGRLSIFAPPRFLNLLREEGRNAGVAKGWKGNSTFHVGELTHLRPNELAVHPAVVSAVAQASGSGPQTRLSLGS
jgi:protein required for attachment to host cells